MLTAIGVMVAIAVVIGLALGWSAIRFKVEGNPLAEKIDAQMDRFCEELGI